MYFEHEHYISSSNDFSLFSGIETYVTIVPTTSVRSEYFMKLHIQ